jgi:CRISPR-associated protein Cas2
MMLNIGLMTQRRRQDDLRGFSATFRLLPFLAHLHMFIIVAYDISEDRRRTRLHKALKHFGYAVQYSVFECHLTASQLMRMKAMINQLIDPRVDQVRFYFLCEACAHRNEATDASILTSDPPVIVI